MVLVLLAPVILAYSNSFDGDFVYDDVQVYANPNIRLTGLDLSSLLKATRGFNVRHRPVANLSFAFNYYFGGLNPFGYHLVNLIIHAVTGIIIFFIFRITLATLGESDEREKTLTAGLAVLVWLLHPLNVQAVSYIVQRMTSLAAFFYLAAFLAWLNGRTGKGRRLVCYLLAGGLWLLALGTKEHTATLPLAVLAYEWIIIRRGRGGWFGRLLPRLVPVLLVLITVSLVFTDFHPLARVLHGYTGRPFGPGERLITEARVLVFYLSLFFLPLPSRLNLEHHFIASTSLLNPPTTLASMVVLAGLLAAALRWRRQYPVAALAVIWFFIVHLVESTIMPLDLSYEHRNYLAIIFMVLALIRSGRKFLRPDWLKLGTALVLVATLAVLVHQRNRVWHDRISLWRDCVAKSPGRLRPRYDLAWNLQLKKRLDEAAGHYMVAIAIDPKYVRSYNNLGLLLMDKGFLDDAVFVLREGIRQIPDYALIHVSLGRVYLKKGQYRRAVEEFAAALRIDPENSPARENLKRLHAVPAFVRSR